MVEEWRKSELLCGYYSVSNLGRVRREVRGSGTQVGRMIVPAPNSDGYLRAEFAMGAVSNCHYIHHLVACAFLGERPLGSEVNHKDRRKANNRSSNLEYLTHGENIAHARKTGWNNAHGEER